MLTYKKEREIQYSLHWKNLPAKQFCPTLSTEQSMSDAWLIFVNPWSPPSDSARAQRLHNKLTSCGDTSRVFLSGRHLALMFVGFCAVTSPRYPGNRYPSLDVGWRWFIYNPECKLYHYCSHWFCFRPTLSHLELGSGPGHGGVWEHWVRPNIKLSITVQRSRLDLNNHDWITNNIPLIIINSSSRSQLCSQCEVQSESCWI